MVKRKRSKIIRPSISSSKFNFREICKQLILLEDHLSDDDKYCIDCIRKHLLSVEGYAEESLTLEPSGEWVADSNLVANLARDWIVRFTDGEKLKKLGQEIRKLRKRLVSKSYDPR